jgi:tripartite-type tricarboxylate transporter receptor subunit TctC
VLPDTPTIAESGVVGYEMSPWIGVFAPAGTPKPVIDRLHAEIGKILRLPEVTQNLSNQALEPSVASVDQFNATIKADYEKYGKLIRLAGARLE